MPRVVNVYLHDECEQVGMSFAVPVADRKKTLQNVLNANYRAGKRLGRKFIARTEGDHIRVWRVE
jgi:hypothetical protein